MQRILDFKTFSEGSAVNVASNFEVKNLRFIFENSWYSRVLYHSARTVCKEGQTGIQILIYYLTRKFLRFSEQNNGKKLHLVVRKSTATRLWIRGTLIVEFKS